MDRNDRTATIRRIKKIWLITALIMAFGISLYVLRPDAAQLKTLVFWGNLAFTFLMVSDGLFLAGFPLLWLLIRNRFMPPLKHWELNAFVEFIHPPKELGAKNIYDLLPPEYFPARYENEAQRKARIRKDKRYLGVIPLIISSLCLILMGVALLRNGLDGLLELFVKEDRSFLALFLTGLVFFPFSYLLIWIGNNFFEPGAKKVRFSDIDPIARILATIVQKLRNKE